MAAGKWKPYQDINSVYLDSYVNLHIEKKIYLALGITKPSPSLQYLTV